MPHLNFIRRICDFCGEKQDFPQGKELTPTQQRDSESWRVVIAEKVNRDSGQITPTTQFYCRVGCAINGLRQESQTIELTDAPQPLALPEASEIIPGVAA